jgi:hypothetical protein
MGMVIEVAKRKRKEQPAGGLKKTYTPTTTQPMVLSERATIFSASPPKLSGIKRIQVDGERFYSGFSFDMDPFIGDGIWWLQIYDEKCALLYDHSFASGMFVFHDREVRKASVESSWKNFFTPGGLSYESTCFHYE